jgi:hypothetical protein
MLSPSISFVIPSRSSKGTGFFYGVITTEIDGWLMPKPLQAAGRSTTVAQEAKMLAPGRAAPQRVACRFAHSGSN